MRMKADTEFQVTFNYHNKKTLLRNSDLIFRHPIWKLHDLPLFFKNFIIKLHFWLWYWSNLSWSTFSFDSLNFLNPLGLAFSNLKLYFRSPPNLSLWDFILYAYWRFSCRALQQQEVPLRKTRLPAAMAIHPVQLAPTVQPASIATLVAPVAFVKK